MLGPLSIEDLDRQREVVLRGIVDRGEVWLISDGGDDFVLGPESVLGRVLGLYDAEYGWPETVAADAPIAAFQPGYRCHPFICQGGRVLAVAVSGKEYADLLRQRES